MRGIKKAGRFNRLVSLWTIGLIADRVEFKASAGGSRRKQVSPSYTSQMCPGCGFVHRQNRNGDRFHCLFCGRAGHSDEFAALNLLYRADDPEILLWMPKERVKAILLSRFSRRLESWDFEFSPEVAKFTALSKVGLEKPATVPGKTQDTQPLVVDGTTSEKVEVSPAITLRPVLSAAEVASLRAKLL